MNMPDHNDEYLTLEEAAKKLKISKVTAYRMARNGKLPAVKLGKAWRISSNRLAQLFENKL